MNLSIDDLIRIIGQLYLENMVLRQQLEQMARIEQEKQEVKPEKEK